MLLTQNITETGTANLFLDYPELMNTAIKQLAETLGAGSDRKGFAPGYEIPETDEMVREFADVATATWRDAGDYRGHRISLLDLTGNPGSNTEKTPAAMLMVARAVEHIRRTGEPVMIFSPTSANKGTALRDAVLRAVKAGLAQPEELRIVTLVPEASMAKLRESELSLDPKLRILNPVLIYRGPDAEGVKPLGRDFAAQYEDQIFAKTGVRLWYSLEYQNYVIADTLRAFFEHSVSPPEADERPRVHAHAVSSAYGLLGYNAGREILEATGLGDVARRPQSLLVQHLYTPYMVLHLLNRDFERSNIPPYEFDPETGLYRQAGDNPHFPEVCYEPDEQIDPTFYTHCPPTAPKMDELVDRFGGSGIVVSLPECLRVYPQLRHRLADTGYELPTDFRTLREWSTVMGFTGTFAAIDRGLISEGSHIVVTGSGTYTTGNFTQLNPRDAFYVRTGKDIADVLLA